MTARLALVKPRTDGAEKTGAKADAAGSARSARAAAAWKVRMVMVGVQRFGCATVFRCGGGVGSRRARTVTDRALPSVELDLSV